MIRLLIVALFVLTKEKSMNILIDIFDDEPIKNIITCMNFKIDKVIYFGQNNVMTLARMRATEKSLKNICEITNVEFIEVSQNNLYKIVELMEREIEKEFRAGGKCFFDLTGGEDLVLVAMGILSTRHKIAMHRFELPKNELCLLNKWDGAPTISEMLESRKVELNLDDIIGLYGGVINYRLQKDVKNHLEDPQFREDVKSMWSVARSNQRDWNGLSSVLKVCGKYEDEFMNTNTPVSILAREIKKVPGIDSVSEFAGYLRKLAEKNILLDLKTGGDYISFSYKSALIRDCLMDAGCLLELHTYYERVESGRYCDCRVGVHIDWDGNINGYEIDVQNEIDVMLLEGLVPVFISCKNGKVNQMALYELDAVASRFGGTYVRKELSATQDITAGYLKRAEEMHIIVNMEK